MTPAPVHASHRLAELVATTDLPDEEVRRRWAEIEAELLQESRHAIEADFLAIHVRDLAFLFAAYDRRFFGGLCAEALGGRKLTFRLSGRMTKTGGTTTRFRTRSGEVSFEIAVAVAMLFDGFNGGGSRTVTVCGLECRTRIEALQRIFEHELVHLVEHLCRDESNCSEARFQGIAKRLFAHRSHKHQLVTRREIAAEQGIHVGSRVRFVFEGRRLEGRVNRITKRATVLVEDAEGRRYSDGRHYVRYYIPVRLLELAGEEGISGRG